MAPTFQPRQRQDQSSCIDHLAIWDPSHIARQKGDTQTILLVFLDHHGILGRLHLPLLTAEDIAPPNAQSPRVPMSQYLFPEHTLEEWKARVAVDSHSATTLAKVICPYHS
jgi:hypothetical protein